MRRFSSLCLMIATLLFAGMSCRPGLRIPEEYRSVLQKLSVEQDGIVRHNLLFVPRGPGPFPLVLVFHGGGGTPEGMVGLDRGRLLQFAQDRDYIVVYPEGVGKHWNDLREDPVSEAHRTNRDDVGFIRTLISKIDAEKRIDRSRIYAAGISNGGFFSFRLACDMPELLKGILVISANLPVAGPDRCHPSRAVSITVLNGTEDPLVPYDGGEVRVLFRGRGHVLSTMATMEFWAGRNKCKAPTKTDLPVAAGEDPTRAVLHRWTCASTRLDLYEIRGGGHTWPGGVPYLGERIVGRVSKQLDASAILADLVVADP